MFRVYATLLTALCLGCSPHDASIVMRLVDQQGNFKDVTRRDLLVLASPVLHGIAESVESEGRGNEVRLPDAAINSGGSLQTITTLEPYSDLLQWALVDQSKDSLFGPDSAARHQRALRLANYLKVGRQVTAEVIRILPRYMEGLHSLCSLYMQPELEYLRNGDLGKEVKNWHHYFLSGACFKDVLWPFSKGHRGGITKVAVSGSGAVLAVLTENNLLCIGRRTKNGILEFRYVDTLKKVNSWDVPLLAVDCEGTEMVCGSGRMLRIYKYVKSTGSLSLSGSPWLVRAELGHQGNRAPAVGHTQELTCLAVSKSGTRIISGSLDESAIVWYQQDDGTWHLEQRLGGCFEKIAGINVHIPYSSEHGHASKIDQVAFGCDETTVLTGSFSSSHATIIGWQHDVALGSWKEVWRLSEPARLFAFTPTKLFFQSERAIKAYKFTAGFKPNVNNHSTVVYELKHNNYVSHVVGGATDTGGCFMIEHAEDECSLVSCIEGVKQPCEVKIGPGWRDKGRIRVCCMAASTLGEIFLVVERDNEAPVLEHRVDGDLECFCRRAADNDFCNWSAHNNYCRSVVYAESSREEECNRKQADAEVDDPRPVAMKVPSVGSTTRPDKHPASLLQKIMQLFCCRKVKR